MSTWSFYRLADGLFTGRRQSGRRLVGIPQECGVVEGAFDHHSQRVDIEAMAKAETGDHSTALDFVVDYQPPQPSPDHEWREDVVNGRPRWVKKAEVVERESRDRQARHRIDELERAQLRPIRELVLDPNSADAKQRLQAIDVEIAAKRADLVTGPARGEREDLER